VTLRTHVSSPAGDRAEVFVSSDASRIPLFRIGSEGDGSDYHVTLTAAGGSASADAELALSPGSHDVAVSVEMDDGERWELVYRVLVEDNGVVTVVLPGLGHHRVDFGNGPVLLKEDVSSVLTKSG
jgi:hypothetical protein